MQTYSPFFQTLHDETGPTGHLGRGTHYSVLRAIVFHDSLGNASTNGRFTDFAVIWDQDHDTRAIEPILEIYRRGLLSSFLMFGEQKGVLTAVLSEKIATSPIQFIDRVDELELSVRAANALSNGRIFYIGDLVQKSETAMLRIPNLGRKAFEQIKEALAEKGLHFGMQVPDWPPENIERVAEAYACHPKEMDRVAFLRSQIGDICESLNDRWSSEVVTFRSEDNPIISDESHRVVLYLKNLAMLWQLGIKSAEPNPLEALMMKHRRSATQ
jgi:hypothetical protein